MSDSYVEVSAEVEVQRSCEDCRAQLLDIDHYIRSNVHAGVRYGWIDPETRRFGTAQSVLGLEQHDVWTIGREPDGLIVQRSDPERGSGAQLTYHLLPVEVGAGEAPRCRLKLEARYPSSTLRRLLGPLWKLGLRKLLERQLDEKRAAMEGKYRGGAAGNLDRAFGLLGAVDGKVWQNPEVARAIVMAACLAAAADGQTDGAERDVLLRLLKTLKHPDLDAAWLERAFDETLALSQTEAMGHVAGLAGSQLKQLGVAREGLVAASIVAQSSTGVALSELAVLERLATSAGLDETAVQEVLLEVDQALSAAA